MSIFYAIAGGMGWFSLMVFAFRSTLDGGGLLAAIVSTASLIIATHSDNPAVVVPGVLLFGLSTIYLVMMSSKKKSLERGSLQ